jgi:ADP-heptose:LPS heptosyltransferase
MTTEDLSVALFKTNYLGDSVLFVPVVKEIRRLRPSWRINLVVSPAQAPLFSGDVGGPDILSVGPERFKAAWKNPVEAASWCRKLLARKVGASLVSYDQGSFAHILARVAGGSIRVGGADLRIRAPTMLTHAVAFADGWSIAQWNWEMARTLLNETGGSGDMASSPPPPTLGHLTGKAPSRPSGVVIHAGSKWTHTRWPLERYAELAGRLSRDFAVTWVTVPETRGAEIPREVKSVECADVGQLARVLAGAQLFIGNNSGPMHLANALGTPVVAITGPSAPEWNPQWWTDRTVVLRTPGLRCAPCDRKQYSPGFCANAEEPVACLRRITVDFVESQGRELLNRTCAGT